MLDTLGTGSILDNEVAERQLLAQPRSASSSATSSDPYFLFSRVSNDMSFSLFDDFLKTSSEGVFFFRTIVKDFSKRLDKCFIQIIL